MEKQKDYYLDGNADPSVPYFFINIKVLDHRKTGIMALNGSRIKICLLSGQKPIKLGFGLKLKRSISAQKFLKQIQEYQVLNANVIDWLILHPEEIPDDWKDKVVLFPGTLYRVKPNMILIRSIFWCSYHLKWKEGFYSSYYNLDNKYFFAVFDNPDT